MFTKISDALSKHRLLAFVFLAFLVGVLVGTGVYAALANRPEQKQASHSPAPASTTIKRGSTKPDTKPQPAAASPRGAASTPAQNPKPAPPPVLVSCTFNSGAHSGDNCPAAPPLSYSAAAPCYTEGNVIACAAYSETRWIAGSYDNGVSTCLFTYWGNNSTGAQTKTVKVTNANPGKTPDCLVETPL